MPTNKILGTTNDITTCEHCGRSDLNHTVVIGAVDADGNDAGILGYYGSTCYAKMIGSTTKAITAEAKDADRAIFIAAALERSKAKSEYDARWFAFLADTAGPGSVWDQIKALGGFKAASEAFEAVAA